MGNQLIKNYDIQKDANGIAGHQCLWKIYKGTNQNLTQKNVSIFMIDKKPFEKINKQVKEEIFVFLRKEAQSLAKFKHPNVLSLVEPILEDNKNMAFIVEDVSNSIAGLFSKNSLNELFPSELETKIHLLEVLQAISFLHNDVKMAHLGLSPENIFLTTKGKWKLGGLIFSTQIVSEDQVIPNNLDFNFRTSEASIKLHPNLNFSAPELGDAQSKCSFSSDIFSLGVIIYLFFKAKNDQNCNDANLFNTANNFSTFKEKVASLNSIFLQKQSQIIPNAFRPIWMRMMSTDWKIRPSINEIINCPWFKDPYIQTLSHLEQINQKEIAQQQSFLKGLGKIILKFEAKVIKTIILPILTDNLKVEHLSPIILQILISIMEKNANIVNKEEFLETIWPSIKLLTNGKEIPAQCLFLIVANLESFCDKITSNDLQASLLPLLIKCYECGVAKLQELALKNTDFLVKNIDFLSVKTKILPRILKLCLDNSIDIRRYSLISLNKIYKLFDKNTQIEQILGVLEKMKKVGTDSKMNIIILSIYEGLADILGIEIITTKILPFLIIHLSDLTLTKSEFLNYMKAINKLLKKVEEERLAVLSQSGSIEENFDMNSIINEIEGPNQAGKKQNEIFAAMQEPVVGVNNDFDFLNMFESNISPTNDTQSQAYKKPEIKKNIEEIKISEKDNPFDKSSDFFNITPQNNNKSMVNKIDPLSLMKPNPVSLAPSIFNKNEADSNNDLAQKNADANLFFSNMNVKPAQPKISQATLNNVFNNFSNSNTNHNNNAQGALGNLNYDPFSEIDMKPTNTFNKTANLTKNNSVNASNKPEGNGWDFDFLNDPNKNKGNFGKNQANLNNLVNIDSNNMNLGSNSMNINMNMGLNNMNINNGQKNFDNNNMNFGNRSMNMNLNMGLNNMNMNMNDGNSNFNNNNSINLENRSMNMNMNMGVNSMNKPSSSNIQNFDFFQGAVPKETNQGLKIKKINFNNDDLI